MKLFTTRQIAEIDKFTIEHEPIKSIDLMERAAQNLSMAITDKFYDFYHNYWFICGPGNNGGDGLALARLLFEEVPMPNFKVVLFADKKKLSDDCRKNWKRIKKIKEIEHFQTLDPDDIDIAEDDLVIDALFGNGLTRSLGEPYKSLIKKINESGAHIISIDMPSGLMGEDNRLNDPEAIVKSDYVLTLEFPKLSFFFPENEPYVKNFEVVPIFLSSRAKEQIESPYYYINIDLAQELLKNRCKFSEKRDFGHALLVAGSYDKTGAAILASKACLRSGVGLLHAHVPRFSVTSMQAALPEAMLSIDADEQIFTQVAIEPYYTAVAVGPGIGTHDKTKDALASLIEKVKEKNLPLVLDADAINILADNKDWLSNLPEQTIITPHVREFDRLFGKHENHYERFLAARELSQKYRIVIVLKGAHTQIHTPQGHVYFNSTGSPAMAKAGMGDVLTGMILSFLAQKYEPVHAAILAVYLHGKAGEICASELSDYSVLPSDLIASIPTAFTYL